ncbi:MAG: hypothetical protein IJZ20_04375 [Clostridia bacterium]|nr:hypothetical protein [Clostridia bacterium]
MKTQVWQKPKTTKLYLQKPLSERLCLLCPDFKVLNLSLKESPHVGQEGVGFILLHGDNPQAFDLDETVFDKVTPGIPVYKLGGVAKCDVILEAFAGDGRNPTVFFKVTATNNTSESVSDSLGIMPRSGKDTYMLNQHQEGYSPYRPNYKNWFMLKRTWTKSDTNSAHSNMGSLRINYDGKIKWISDSKTKSVFDASDYFEVSFTLSPGESTTLTGALKANGESEEFCYENELEKTVKYWESIGNKITSVPDCDGEYMDIFKHMAMICMQMFAHYEGSELVTVRQGDVGRFVWPYEGAQVINMMDKIGLSEYTFDACKYYLERWYTRDGESAGKIGSTAGWENFTGSVIWTISEHLKASKSSAELEYFLPYLVGMREWIERRRSEPRASGYAGIFPPGKGSDWADVAQFWTFTDSHNAMALKSMYETLEYFNHPEAKRTKEIWQDYHDTLTAIRDELYAGHEDDEMYILPHELGVPFEDSENYSYYTDGAPYLLYTGIIEPGSRLQKQMEAFFRIRGQFENGLTGRMTSCSSMWDEAYFGGYGDVWYTMQSETYWVKAWMKSGEKDKAKETLDAMIKFGMTEEYVVSERYCSINPWYNPWQPNGSGSSRMIEMLFAYFGEK